MKTTYLAILLLGCLLPLNTFAAEETVKSTDTKETTTPTTTAPKNLPALQKAKVYDIQSGKIRYLVTGPNDVIGTKTVIFREWGHLHREDTIINIANQEQTQIIIINGYKAYSIAPQNSRALVTDIPRYKAGIDLKQLAETYGSEENAIKQMKTSGIKLLKGENVLGYPCQVVQTSHDTIQTTMWIHKGLLLKTQTKDPNNTLLESAEATIVDFNTFVSAAHFTIPKGIPVMSIQEFMKESTEAFAKDKAKGFQKYD